MGTVDFDSETGDTWARMVYDMTRKNPRALRYRPAVDRSEQLLADEVNRHMERIVIGVGGHPQRATARRGQKAMRAMKRVRPACERCGSTRGPLFEFGAVYTSDGKISRYRCAEYCQ